MRYFGIMTSENLTTINEEYDDFKNITFVSKHEFGTKG